MTRSFQFAFALLLIPIAVPADVIRHTLAPGVEFSQEIISPPEGPLVIIILRIDLKQPGVKIRSQLAGDTVIEDNATKGREPVGVLAERHKALAAVNGDFFPYTGDPLGIAIRDGELISEGLPHRAAMGITKDGKLVFDTLACVGTLTAADGMTWSIDGVNRGLNTDELILLTPTFGEKTRLPPGATVIPLNHPELPLKVGTDHSAIAGDFGTGITVTSIQNNGAILGASGRSADWLKSHVKPGDQIHVRFAMYPNPLPSSMTRRALMDYF